MSDVTEASIADQIHERIDRYVRTGLLPSEAAERTLSWILKSDRADEVLKELGGQALLAFWKNQVQHDRHALIVGTRRVNIGTLNDAAEMLMESLWGTAEWWKPLGDLTRDDCESLALWYEKLIATNARRAGIFRKLAKELGDNKPVRKHFTEEQLRELFGKEQP